MRLTYPKVTAAARRVLRKYGTEFVYLDKYPICQYDNGPCGIGCFVGEIYVELGLGRPSNAWGSVPALFDWGSPDGRTDANGNTVTEKAFAFLDAAQTTQDNRTGGLPRAYTSWGHAFADGVRAATLVW